MKKNIAGTIILVFEILVSIFFIGVLWQSKMLSMKYLIPISIVLILFILFFRFMFFSKKINTITRILSNILCVVLCGCMIFACVSLQKGKDTIEQVTSIDTQNFKTHVIVLKDSKLTRLNQLKHDQIIGIQTLLDRDNIDVTVDKINLKLAKYGKTVQTYEFYGYKQQLDALYKKQISAIILNESNRKVVEEFYPDFSKETRVIATFENHMKVNTESKPVDVTEEPFNVFFSGLDVYGDVNVASRSDVNMIATINPKTKQIMLTSTPRDYYVPLSLEEDKHPKDKLTHAGLYGVDCSIRTIEDLYDTEINYYVKLNFTSLMTIVDTMGGVEVENDRDFDAWSDVTQMMYHFDKGTITLNGVTALVFARERHAFGDGDFQRIANQQKIIKGMIKKIASPAILTHYDQLLEDMTGFFETNMSSDEIYALIKMQLDDFASWEIISTAPLGTPGYEYSYASASNASVILTEPNSVEIISGKIKEMLSGKKMKPFEVTGE